MIELNKYVLSIVRYLGGPGTCIALGIGRLIVDNDAEGYFLSPCPMFSDCIYFRVLYYYDR